MAMRLKRWGSIVLAWGWGLGYKRCDWINNMHIGLNNSAGQFAQMGSTLETRVSPELMAFGEHACGSLVGELDDFELEPRQESEPQFPPCSQESQHENECLLDCCEGPWSPRGQEFFQVRHKEEEEEDVLVENWTQEAASGVPSQKIQGKVQSIVEYLVDHAAHPSNTALEEGRRLVGSSRDLREIYEILVQKFKRLRKTKEEMTKYCMRKAFKFIADKMKRDRAHNRDVDSCMRLYFARQSTSAFTIPFKKNSVEKTMNGSFLKRVFACPLFVQDYREFLEEFHEVMVEDNAKKVTYLAQVVEECLETSDVKRVETIKRLPWTRSILLQTEQLALTLLSYAEPCEVISPRKHK